MTTGKPRKPQGDAELERRRENARRYYYGIPPITKERHKQDPAVTKQRNNDYKRNRRQQIIDALAEYKLAKQCADCDRHFDKPYHLDFDHLPGVDKSFNLSKPGGRSWEVIMAEVDKCEVVCALCHRDRTMARKQGDPSWGRHGVGEGDDQPRLWG